jgi:hypothetical protein
MAGAAAGAAIGTRPRGVSAIAGSAGRPVKVIASSTAANAPRKEAGMSEATPQRDWKTQPDGSRVRLSNGIRIVDRSAVPNQAADEASSIEHLVTWQEDDGTVVVIGLDGACTAVYSTVLKRSGGERRSSPDG